MSVLHDAEDYTKWLDIILNLMLLLPMLSIALLQCRPRKPRDCDRNTPAAAIMRSAESIDNAGVEQSTASKQSRQNPSKQEEEKIPSYLKSTQAKPNVDLTDSTPKSAEPHKKLKKRDRTTTTEKTQNESTKTDYTTPPWLRWKKLSTPAGAVIDADYFQRGAAVDTLKPVGAPPPREPSTRTVLPAAKAAGEHTARLVERTQMMPPTTAMAAVVDYGRGVGKSKSMNEGSSKVASHHSAIPFVSLISPLHSGAMARQKKRHSSSSSSSSERSNTTSKQRRRQAGGSKRKTTPKP